MRVYKAVKTIKSSEIARVVQMDHAELMQIIDTFINDVKDSPGADINKFFIPSQYKGERSYDLTKMGCEVVATKLTGNQKYILNANIDRMNAINRCAEGVELIKQSKYRWLLYLPYWLVKILLCVQMKIDAIFKNKSRNN